MDPRIIQMIMALISRNSQAQPFGGNGNPQQIGGGMYDGSTGWGPVGGMQGGGQQIGRPPGYSPGYGAMGQMPGRNLQPQGNPRLQGGIGQPNNIPTGQPPMGQNLLQRAIDYRNGSVSSQQPSQGPMGGAPGNPFRVR